VPRALVDRDTRGLVKIVAERGTGRVLGVSMADTWAPYLTMGEGLRLAAQAFTRDITKLSCCAA
jgi:mercuric reductase